MTRPSTPRCWRVSRERELVVDRPRLMAIINVTPDSFFDGGAYTSVSAAVEAAARAVDEGADVLDVGGESTRPGSEPVSAEEQTRRTAPVIFEIRKRLGLRPIITIDTTNAAVARAALHAGADAVNDTSAGRDDGAMLPLIAAAGCGVVLMHRLAKPARDSYSDRYASPPDYSAEGGIVRAVRAFLSERVEAAVAAGVSRERIVIDPGLGFGKTVSQNMELIDGTPEFCGLGLPVLSGLSRKSFTGHFQSGASTAEGSVSVGSTPADRLPQTLALSLRHWRAGASIFRVHDVAAHVSVFGTDARPRSSHTDRTPIKPRRAE